MQKLHSNQRMSQIVIHNQTIYLSGQVGNSEEDIKAQTLTCLEKVEKLLQEVGSDKSKLLSATVWLKSMSDFARTNHESSDEKNIVEDDIIIEKEDK